MSAVQLNKNVECVYARRTDANDVEICERRTISKEPWDFMFVCRAQF